MTPRLPQLTLGSSNTAYWKNALDSYSAWAEEHRVRSRNPITTGTIERFCRFLDVDAYFLDSTAFELLVEWANDDAARAHDDAARAHETAEMLRPLFETLLSSVDLEATLAAAGFKH